MQSHKQFSTISVTATECPQCTAAASGWIFEQDDHLAHDLGTDIQGGRTMSSIWQSLAAAQGGIAFQWLYR